MGCRPLDRGTEENLGGIPEASDGGDDLHPARAVGGARGLADKSRRHDRRARLNPVLERREEVRRRRSPRTAGKSIERLEVDAKSRIETDIDYERPGKQVGWLYLPHSVTRSAYGNISI